MLITFFRPEGLGKVNGSSIRYGLRAGERANRSWADIELKLCSHYLDSFSWRREKLFVIVWTEMAQNWNKSFIHIKHRAGADWPRGFGEQNPSPHSWIFTSVSIDSSPRSYLFTSATVWIPFHTAPKCKDQFRFLGNCPPTPPLTQHLALSEK